MELILVLIVVIVLCKILGVSNEMIIAGGLVLIELTIIAMLLLFLFFYLISNSDWNYNITIKV